MPRHVAKKDNNVHATLTCYPVGCIVRIFFKCGFQATVAPPLPIPYGTTHNGCMALSNQLRFVLVPLDHEPFDYLEDPPVLLTRLLCCNDPHDGIYSKHQRDMDFPSTPPWLETP